MKGINLIAQQFQKAQLRITESIIFKGIFAKLQIHANA